MSNEKTDRCTTCRHYPRGSVECSICVDRDKWQPTYEALAADSSRKDAVIAEQVAAAASTVSGLRHLKARASLTGSEHDLADSMQNDLLAAIAKATKEIDHA